MQSRTVYKEAVRVFDSSVQIDIMVEECAEMIDALQKHKRMRPCNVSEEIADVEIMAAQMRLLFPGVKEIKIKKMGMLEKLINERKEGMSGHTISEA